MAKTRVRLLQVNSINCHNQSNPHSIDEQINAAIGDLESRGYRVVTPVPTPNLQIACHVGEQIGEVLITYQID